MFVSLLLCLGSLGHFCFGMQILTLVDITEFMVHFFRVFVPISRTKIDFLHLFQLFLNFVVIHVDFVKFVFECTIVLL